MYDPFLKYRTKFRVDESYGCCEKCDEKYWLRMEKYWLRMEKYWLQMEKYWLRMGKKGWKEVNLPTVKSFDLGQASWPA